MGMFADPLRGTPMVPTTTNTPVFTIAPEVYAYAEEEGVTAYLQPVLEMTRQHFPDARRFDAFVEDDPELRDVRFLILRVELPPCDPVQAVERKFRWSHEVAKICTSAHALAFTLRMRVSEA
jgi:hypothetical protein